MILSGRDLAWYIETGKLKIDPVTPEQFQQNGVDLILADVRFVDQNLEVGFGGGSAGFHKGNFYLGCTREVLELPDDLMAFVELRSTWARRGLMLPPTIVDAGFCGNLTLEIGAWSDMDVPIGERFAHLIFAKLTSPAVPYSGKYQNQRGITGAK